MQKIEDLDRNLSQEIAQIMSATSSTESQINRQKEIEFRE